MNNDNLAVLEQEIIDAENAPETQVERIVIDKGAGDSLPVSVSSISGNDYVWVYDTQTYERSRICKNMLPLQLKKKRADGSRVFTTVKPKEKPVRGTFKCMLHPDAPNRQHYDEIGLAVCHKDNLTSPYQVKRHMQKKHKDEYASILEEKADADKAREESNRERDRAFMEALAAKQSSGDAKPSPSVFVCDICNKEFDSKIALLGHKRSHKDK